MWQLVSYSWRDNYTVFWLTDWYHSWPHVEYKSFKPIADDSFQPDSDEYFQALLFLAAIPLAWLLITILIVFFYCCLGFLRKRRSSSSPRHSPRTNPTTKKWFLAIVAFFSLAFIILGFYGNEETATAVNRLTSAAKDLNMTVDGISTEVNKLNTTYNKDVPIVIQNLNDTFQSVSDQQNRTKLLELTAQLDQYTEITGKNIEEISSDANNVQLDLEAKADDLEKYEYFRWIGTVALFCLEIIVCLIALCAVGKGSRCLLVFVSVVCVLFVILIWCRMAIEIFITVGASDFCVDPNSYVLSYTDEKADINQDVVLYYLTCYPNSENPYGNSLRDAQKYQALAETTLDSIQKIGSTYPPATDTLNQLESTFQSASIDLQDLVASINCNTLNTDYVIGLYSLCYDTITGISFMMVSSILSGLLFTVLIFISSCTVPVINKRKADYEVDREDPFLPPDNPSATLERFSRRNEPQRSPQRNSALGSPTIPDYNREPSFAASSVAYNQDYRYEDDPLLRRHGHDSPPPSYNFAVTRQSSAEFGGNNQPTSASNNQSYIQHLGQGDGVMQRALIY